MFPLRNVNWGIVRLGSLGKIVGDVAGLVPPAVASIIAGANRAPPDASEGAQEGRPRVRFSEHLSAEHGEAMFRHACTVGLEGIISKKLSRYKSGACRSWLKVKNPAYEPRGVP